MKAFPQYLASVTWCLPAALLLGCNSDCVQPPCALPIAMRVAVTSSVSGDPIDDAVLQVSDTSDSGQYPVHGEGAGTYVVLGGAGTYRVTLSAPSFETVERTVVVSPSPPVRCGCSGVNTAQVAVAMIPTTQ